MPHVLARFTAKGPYRTLGHCLSEGALDDATQARFWSKVDIRGPNECWNWQASISAKGYGRFCVRDHHIARAHRIAWELHHGQRIEAEAFICHSCDNRACCNPAHLWRGDNAANMLDMAQKGRGWQQQKTHCANGHEFTPENTYWRKASVGRRDCRICRRARHKAYKARKHARPTAESASPKPSQGDTE